MKSVEGIILKKTPRREADLVLKLYTKEHGLAEFQARGARKQEAKLKAGLDVFNFVELFYVPAKHLPIATDFKIKNDFKILKADIKRLKLASFLVHIMDRIFEPGLADQAVWQSVFDYFHNINLPVLTRENMVNLAYAWCHQILVLNGLDPKSPEFKEVSEAELRKKTQNLFSHHFGVELVKLL